MTSRAEYIVSAVWRLLARLTLIAGIVFVCYKLRSIIITLFVAAIIAYVLDPLVEWLRTRPRFIKTHNDIANLVARLRPFVYRLVGQTAPVPRPASALRIHTLRAFATFYTFVLAILLLWQGTQTLATPFVVEFQHLISAEGQAEFRRNVESVLALYDQKAPDWAKADKIREMVANSDLPRTLSSLAGDIGKRLVENAKYVVEIVLLPVLAFYFLIDGRALKHEFLGLVPRRYRRDTFRISHEFNHIMRAFIAGQFIVCLLAGVVVWIGLAALRVDYALLLGILAGLTRAIPVIGPVIGGIPIILLTLASKGLPTALLVLAFFTLLHFAESKFILPLLLGERMELHPVVIIVVLIVGGELGGILIGGTLGALLGMFFAAPLASILRVIVRRYWLRVSPRGHSPRPSVPPSASEPVGVSRAATLPEVVD